MDELFQKMCNLSQIDKESLLCRLFGHMTVLKDENRKFDPETFFEIIKSYED